MTFIDSILNQPSLKARFSVGIYHQLAPIFSEINAPKRLLCMALRHGCHPLRSHTVNHKKLPTLSPQDLNYEFSEDQVKLRNCIGNLDRNQTVASYVAYPFGADDEQVDQSAARYFLAGYLYNDATFKLVQHLKSGLSSKINRYRIPRLTIDPLISVEKLKNMAAGSARFESLFLKETEPELHFQAQGRVTYSQH